MDTRPDIAVYSPDGRIQLVVEIKTRKGVSDDWAAQLRRNLIVHSAIPRSKFFLLALPDYFYLWKEDYSPSVKPPDYKAKSKEMLRNYLTTLDVQTLSEPGLELIVEAWLDDLINSELDKSSLGPEWNWLFDSGLYESIKRGSIVVESVA
ncbi:MAG: hypothetical protein L0177_04775 [Chloroflexi bacterium]|nr:hypothetical protein [Chloroflexota bacterium]